MSPVSKLLSPHPSRRRVLLADLLLLSVAVIWGANFVVIKDAVERTSAVAAGSIVAGTFLYLLPRYAMATAGLAVALPSSWRQATRAHWWRGALLGGSYTTAVILQTIGLQGTTPGVSGFITGLSVAMVPLLYWLVSRRSPGRWQFVGAAVAMSGVGILSLQGDISIGTGDALTLGGALFYALHIMATGFFAPVVPPATLTFTQIAASTVALSIMTPWFAPFMLDLPWHVWAAVVWTAFANTVYGFFVQSWAQQRTPATHAGILLGFESLFAAVAGVLVGMDPVTWRLLLGGSLMLASVFIVELPPSSLPASSGGQMSDGEVPARA